MIFLGMTMGFFAENIREYFSETKTAKEYLEAFENELKQNESSIHQYGSIISLILPIHDSIVNVFFEKKENEDLNKMARLERKGRMILNVPLQTSAYTQIVNSGGLKYIRGKALRDSMAMYQGMIQVYIKYNELFFQQRTLFLPTIASIQDWHVGLDTLSQIMPFPVLTERERRLIIAYYRHYYIQYKNDQNGLRKIKRAGGNLEGMIAKEL
jgi:hypothetical protein